MNEKSKAKIARSNPPTQAAPTVVRCRFIKADGEQCRNNAIDGKLYCRLVAHREATHQRATKRGWLAVQVFLGFCTVLGAITVAYGLLTNFALVVAGDLLRDGYPLSAPLTVTNNSSIFTLVDVAPTCFTNELLYANDQSDHHSILGGYQPRIPVLAPTGTDTIYCFGDQRGLRWPAPFKSADVIIAVQYALGINFGGCVIKLPFIGRESEQRLRTVTNSDGKMRWLPWGLRSAPYFEPHQKPEPNTPNQYEPMLPASSGICR